MRNIHDSWKPILTPEFKTPYFLDLVDFVKKEYDILINLCDSSIIPMKYLIASSVARFKIGIYEKNYEIYDLMISLKAYQV